MNTGRCPIPLTGRLPVYQAEKANNELRSYRIFEC